MSDAENVRDLAGAGVLAGAFFLTGLVIVFEPTLLAAALALVAWTVGAGLLAGGFDE